MNISGILDSRITVYSLIGLSTLLVIGNALFLAVSVDALDDVERLNQTKQEMSDMIQTQNQTIKTIEMEKESLEQNISQLQSVKSDLNSEVSSLESSLETERNRPRLFSSLDYWRSSGLQSGEFSITMYNFGNSEARGVDVGCGLMREDSNSFYYTVSGEFGNVASDSTNTETFTFTMDDKEIETGDTMACYVIGAEKGEILGEDLFEDSLNEFSSYDSSSGIKS